MRRKKQTELQDANLEFREKKQESCNSDFSQSCDLGLQNQS